MQIICLRHLQAKKTCVLACILTILLHLFLILLTREAEYYKERKSEIPQLGSRIFISPVEPTAEESSKSDLVNDDVIHDDINTTYGNLKRMFSCEEIIEFKKRATVVRKANEHGNKVIYKVDLKNESLILKEANFENASESMEVFRYNAALREIANLEKLETTGFQNFAHLRGKCVTPSFALFAVDFAADSKPFCAGNGTDIRCLMMEDLKESIHSAHDTTLASALWLEKATCFFKQFSQYSIFMEDMSGANLFFSPYTWSVTLVDADSLIFYSNASILSRMACRVDRECPKPSGSLWPWHSLNRKIYGKCNEMRGRCVNNVCKGYGANLHACGIGYWLLTPLMRTLPTKYYMEAKMIRSCLMAPSPEDRCSLEYACNKAKGMLKSVKSKKS